MCLNIRGLIKLHYKVFNKLVSWNVFEVKILSSKGVTILTYICLNCIKNSFIKKSKVFIGYLVWQNSRGRYIDEVLRIFLKNAILRIL